MNTKCKGTTIIRNAKKHEALLRKGIEDGLTYEQIANSIGCNSGSVRTWSRALDLPPPKRKPDVRMQKERINKIIRQRNKGLTLKEIGDGMGLSSERIRQVLARYSPDQVIATRIAAVKTCSICGKKFCGNTKTCSGACGGALRYSGKWTRDKAVEVIALRKSGKTWDQVSQILHPGSHALAFRTALQREKDKLFSTKEWSEISGHAKYKYGEKQPSLYARLMKRFKA